MGVCQFLPLSSSSHLFFFVFCPKVCEGAVRSACIAKRYKTHLILTARTNVGGFLLAPKNLPWGFQGGEGGEGSTGRCGERSRESFASLPSSSCLSPPYPYAPFWYKYRPKSIPPLTRQAHSFEAPGTGWDVIIQFPSPPLVPYPPPVHTHIHTKSVRQRRRFQSFPRESLPS